MRKVPLAQITGSSRFMHSNLAGQARKTKPGYGAGERILALIAGPICGGRQRQRIAGVIRSVAGAGVEIFGATGIELTAGDEEKARSSTAPTRVLD